MVKSNKIIFLKYHNQKRLTCSINMKLVDDTFVSTTEDHHHISNRHCPVSMSWSWSNPRCTIYSSPLGIQRCRHLESEVHSQVTLICDKMQIQRRGLLLVSTATSGNFF